METDLLPEYLRIWKRRIKVFPFINRVRKCSNCARWGHSAPFCRGSRACGRCSDDHATSSCYSVAVKCVNCGGDHDSFNPVCKVFLRHKIINAVMAFANVSRISSIKMIKSRNIHSLEQVENNFRTLAYRSWDVRDLDLISAGRRDRMHSSVNVSKGNRKVGAGSGLSLPVISSSRYLSCIESPAHTNTNSVISSQDIHPHGMSLNNEEEVPVGSASIRDTPLEERISLAGRRMWLVVMMIC